MSEKRRDNKRRILRTGESQRKDGRYLYKYVDAFGVTQHVYSWKLVRQTAFQRASVTVFRFVKKNVRYKRTSRTVLTQQERK